MMVQQTFPFSEEAYRRVLDQVGAWSRNDVDHNQSSAAGHDESISIDVIGARLVR